MLQLHLLLHVALLLQCLIGCHGYFLRLPSSTKVSLTSTQLDVRAGSDRAFAGDSSTIHPTSVLVIGATGRVGKEVVKKLSSFHKECKINCLVRDISSKDAINLASNSNVELYEGSVDNMDSLVAATKGCQVVVDVHGMKPPRFTKLPYDLFFHPSKDKTHPYNVNYLGTKRVLAAMKINNVQKLVRITGSLTGKSALFILTIMFNLLLSMSPKWHERSEMIIRESGIDYTVIRPTGISSEPSAIDTQRSLIMLQGDTKQRPPKNANKISVQDLSELIFRSTQNLRYLSRTSVVVSSRVGTDGMQDWNQQVIESMYPDHITMKPHRHALVTSLVGSLLIPSLISGIYFIVKQIVKTIKAFTVRMSV